MTTLLEGFDKLYTVDEIAKQFNVNAETVRLWIRRRKLRAAKIGKNWLVTEADLKAFVMERYQFKEEEG